jgi:hypothetical protein
MFQKYLLSMFIDVTKFDILQHESRDFVGRQYFSRHIGIRRKNVAPTFQPFFVDG